MKDNIDFSYEMAVEEFGGKRPAANALGIPYSTLWDRLKKEENDENRPVIEVKYHPRQTKKRPLPKKGEIKRYLLTCAQNNTPVREDVWRTIKTVAEHYDAEILVSPILYIRIDKEDEVAYDKKVEKYLNNEREELATDFVWAGELNVLPSATKPLTSLFNYTGYKSMAMGHPRVAVESVPTGVDSPTKFCYTTGTLTEKNYIQRKAGQRAEHHHQFGCLLLEVNHEGDWWARQLISDEDGVICDLNHTFRGQTVGQTDVKVVTWGDIHVEVLDEVVQKTNWGLNGIAMTLRPEYQMMHDLYDHHARNHHGINNHIQRFRDYSNDQDTVESEVQKTMQWLNDRVVEADGWEGKCAVVQSNHDEALTRWLAQADFRYDEKNALFYLRCQLRLYEAIHDKEENFHLLEWLYKKYHGEDDVKFLRVNESLKIDDVEHGCHGDKGANGSRGSISGYSRMGVKMTIGHSHQAGVCDGIYQAGTSSRLRLGYNAGPSSWSHSHVVQYKNGKRALITMRENGKWRA